MKKKGNMSAEDTDDELKGGATPSEVILCLTACWPIFAPGLAALIDLGIPRNTALPISFGGIATYGLLVGGLAASLKVIAARLTGVVVAIFTALTVAFCAMAIGDGAHGDFYFELSTRALLLSAPWLLVMNAVRDFRILLRCLHVSALVLVAATALREVLPAQRISVATYSQYDGYLILPAAVILADYFVRRRRISSLLLFLVSVGLLLAAGARGPLLAVLLFLLTRTAVALRRRPLAVVALVVAGGALAQWFNLIVPAVLRVVAKAFQAQGLSTRVLERLIDGNFLQDKARASLAEFSWRYILNHPVAGVGIARDRLLLANAMGERDPAMFEGWYPHNIILEMLLQYGVFLGTALLGTLTVLVVKAVLNGSEPAMGRVVLVFVGIGLWPLLVSGSYLISPLFFALIGLCLASRHHQAVEVRRRSPLAMRR